MKKLLFIVNTTTFFLSHRLSIALAAQQAGYDVHIATGTPDTHAQAQLNHYNLTHHFVPISRSGKNLVLEVSSFWALKQLMERLAPDVVHLVTIKPVLYGGLAARLTKVPAMVAAISGLGTVYSDNSSGWMTKKIVKFLYKLALKHPNSAVIFQNNDDKKELFKLGAMEPGDCYLIKGSGVDLTGYTPSKEPEDCIVVVMAARLILEKGVREFIQAAQILNDRGTDVKFWLAGSIDNGNPNTVTDSMLEEWRQIDNVEILGDRTDISALFSQAHIVVLPSYYGEGLPKVLIEAAACGRAVITTDHPGCRDAILKNQTGLLIPTRDSRALADAVQQLIDNPELRKRMGEAGRKLAEQEFDIQRVIERHLMIYEKLGHTISS